MICRCLGNKLSKRLISHFSSASGKTVWLPSASHSRRMDGVAYFVYANTLVVIFQAVAYGTSSSSIRIRMSSGMAKVGCVSFTGVSRIHDGARESSLWMQT